MMCSTQTGLVTYPAWAVVQHVRSNFQDPSMDDFVVTQCSHVCGTQSINRGKLGSVAWLARFFAQSRPRQFMSVYTDSEFVRRIVDAVSSNTLDPRMYQKVHADLIQTVHQFRDPMYHDIRKDTKS